MRERKKWNKTDGRCIERYAKARAHEMNMIGSDRQDRLTFFFWYCAVGSWLYQAAWLLVLMAHSPHGLLFLRLSRFASALSWLLCFDISVTCGESDEKVSVSFPISSTELPIRNCPCSVATRRSFMVKVRLVHLETIDSARREKIVRARNYKYYTAKWSV